jgi:hypothetical protein
LEVYRTLSLQRDLSPDNEIVTSTLTYFVAFLKAEFEKEWAHDLPSDPALADAAANLPRLCGLAEVEMEKWWTRRLLMETSLGCASLKAFWYYENYRHLVEAELPLLNVSGSDRVVFLGSGPLPLTAILLAKSVPQLSIQCVDRDQEACDLASQLIEKLRLTARVEIVNADAEDCNFYRDDRVICANLLSAPGIFGSLLSVGVDAFILRSVAGLFRFCYRQAPEPSSAYCFAGETPVSPRSINVSRLYRLSRG